MKQRQAAEEAVDEEELSSSEWLAREQAAEEAADGEELTGSEWLARGQAAKARRDPPEESQDEPAVTVDELEADESEPQIAEAEEEGFGEAGVVVVDLAEDDEWGGADSDKEVDDRLAQEALESGEAAAVELVRAQLEEELAQKKRLLDKLRHRALQAGP